MILTDEERTEAYEEFMHQSLRPQDTKVVLQYARAIEAKIMPRIRKLEAENEALRKDAERYRRLRKIFEESVAGGIQVNDEKLGYEEPKPGEAVRIFWYPDTPIGFYECKADSLDAAVDALELEDLR